MQRSVILGLGVAWLLLSACSGGSKQEGAEGVAPERERAEAVVSNDSTIYGTAGEFGMSSFTLISEDGDTLFLTRSTTEGVYGKIYGSLEEGARYALTTCEDGQAIGTLINLSELDRHLRSYRLWNGLLIMGEDTMEIGMLSQEGLTLKK